MSLIAISSHVKDKNSIFTACGEDMIFFINGKILVFHQYLYNKNISHCMRTDFQFPGRAQKTKVQLPRASKFDSCESEN